MLLRVATGGGAGAVLLRPKEPPPNSWSCLSTCSGPCSCSGSATLFSSSFAADGTTPSLLVDGGSATSASLPDTAGPCICAGRGTLAEPVGDIPNGIFLSIPPKLPAPPRLGLLVSASEEEEEGRGGGAGGSPLID